jgi:hypothetical protein
MLCHGIHTLGWRFHFVHRMSEEGILSRAKMMEGKSKQVPLRTLKAYEVKIWKLNNSRWPRGGAEVNSTVSLISALDGGKWSTKRPGRFTPDTESRYPLYGWDPGPVWTGAENLASTGIRSPDRPARSESLYRLRYPGPSGGIAPLILIINPRWRRLSVFLPGRMISRCCLNRRLTGPHSHLGCLGDARDLILLPGIEPRFLGSPLRSPVTIRLRYRGSVVTRSSTHFQVFSPSPHCTIVNWQIGTENCRKSGLASAGRRPPHPLPGTTGRPRGEMQDCLRD